jgi:purine-nucleoside phosphorylase
MDTSEGPRPIELEVAVPKSLAGAHSDVAVVLGSGLSAFAEGLPSPVLVPYDDIEGFPRSGADVVGHAGRLALADVDGLAVAAFQGRVHMYQGFDALEAAYPVRLASALGATTLVVTNAAGGVAGGLAPGDLMLLADQMNLTGRNPLVSWPGPEGGNPFVPMSDAYDAGLRELARDVAATEGVELKEGVYAGLLGPTYETPAEAAMLRSLGADAVGMSTVVEVITARALGMRALGISLIANVAAGAHLSHDEVLAAGEQAADRLSRLLTGILFRLKA